MNSRRKSKKVKTNTAVVISDAEAESENGAILPPELLHNVLGYMLPEDSTSFINSRLVCRLWNQTANLAFANKAMKQHYQAQVGEITCNMDTDKLSNKEAAVIKFKINNAQKSLMQELQACPYWHPNLDRAGAEAALGYFPPGNIIIRPSSHIGQLVLSVIAECNLGEELEGDLADQVLKLKNQPIKVIEKSNDVELPPGHAYVHVLFAILCDKESWSLKQLTNFGPKQSFKSVNELIECFQDDKQYAFIRREELDSALLVGKKEGEGLPQFTDPTSLNLNFVGLNPNPNDAVWENLNLDRLLNGFKKP